MNARGRQLRFRVTQRNFCRIQSTRGTCILYIYVYLGTCGTVQLHSVMGIPIIEDREFSSSRGSVMRRFYCTRNTCVDDLTAKRAQPKTVIKSQRFPTREGGGNTFNGLADLRINVSTSRHFTIMFDDTIVVFRKFIPSQFSSFASSCDVWVLCALRRTQAFRPNRKLTLDLSAPPFAVYDSTHNVQFSLNITSVYMYIYVCSCVCVCVCLFLFSSSYYCLPEKYTQVAISKRTNYCSIQWRQMFTIDKSELKSTLLRLPYSTYPPLII